MLPIEVKAGAGGRLKSLHQFIRERELLLGVQISEAPLAWKKPILSIPFYMISELSRLTKQAV